MLIAITREVSPSIGRCELTHSSRQVIDVALARAQHRRYEDCLATLGCKVHTLRAEPALPDSVFVEDTAIVLDELAIITRPGVVSRRPETESIAQALEPYRMLAYIESPGIVDGGDVLHMSRTLFMGLSGRTNRAGIEQVRTLVEPFGYQVKGVLVDGCLHLKSAVTKVRQNTLLIHPNWVKASAFDEMDLIQVDPSEPYGGNALLVGKVVVYSSAFPRTRARLERHGIEVTVVDISELAKAEGGVTCCSLILMPDPENRFC